MDLDDVIRKSTRWLNIFCVMSWIVILMSYVNNTKCNLSAQMISTEMRASVKETNYATFEAKRSSKGTI